MFEMIYGERPFRTKLRKELIKKGTFRFPNQVTVSDVCKDAISSFMRMDAHTRLGVGFEGMMALRRHKFFSCLDWSTIHHKALQPAYVPDATVDNHASDIDIEDLQKVFKAVPKKRKSTKIMSADMITIYYEFGVCC